MISKPLRQTAWKPVGIQGTKANAVTKAFAAALIFTSLALFVFLEAKWTWNVATASPWSALNMDQMAVAAMYYKREDPTLFSRDYVFHDDRYISHYTPSFHLLMTPLVTITGDYVRGLAALQGPVLALYLAAAYLLFWQVSRSRGIAVICALLSTMIVVGGDVWGVLGLSAMLPRTLALPPLVLAIYLFIRLLSVEDPLHQRAWPWAILGLLLGVVAELHPATGLSSAIAVGITALASWQRLKQPAYMSIVLLVVGTLVSSAPILWNVSSATRVPSGESSPDFESFLTAFRGLFILSDRVFMLPYHNFWTRLAMLPDELQFTFGLLWLPVTLFAWYGMRRNQHSWLAVLFACAQLFYTWLWVKGIHSIWFIIPVFLFLWRWWEKDEAREMVLFEIMAGIIAASFFLPVVLYAIWVNLEVWSITTVVAELSRGTRTLTLVFFLTIARFGMHSLDLLRRWNQTEPLLCSIWVGVVGGLGLEAAVRTAVPIAESGNFYRMVSVVSLAAGATAAVVTLLLHQPGLSTGSLRRWLATAIGVGTITVLLAGAFLFPNELSRKFVEIQLRASEGIAFLTGSPKDQAAVPGLIQAAQWARLHTDRDALFLYARGNVARTMGATEFRFWSKRSISYDWRSRDRVAYSRPADLVSMSLQFQRVIDASRSPDRLVRLAHELSVNYIVHDAGMFLDLPVAYKTTDVTVYKVGTPSTNGTRPGSN